ncbi:MAG: HD domain-containing phosphohydrolase, partial [Planctomycetota bacterium]
MNGPAEDPVFPAFLDALPCPAARVDIEGRVVQANRRWAAKLIELSLDPDRLPNGVTPEQLQSNTPTQVLIQRKAGPVALTVAGQLPGVVVFLDTTAQHDLLTTVAQLSDNAATSAMQIAEMNDELERRVAERTEELADANLDALTMLAVASEARDADTGAHVRRIERMARDTALALGLEQDFAQHLGRSAILHDIGKITVADDILKKPGPLTPDERTAMEQHTLAGENILGSNPYFDLARVIARAHHENFDGTGYPDALEGDDIPLPARIVHAVDVYDALRSPRIYKDPWSDRDTLALLEEQAGTAFDPQVIDAFLTT